jgi:basic amino acid/polyamine antiporter, APA family
VTDGGRTAVPGLGSRLRWSQFLSIGLGAIMGVAWAIVLGEWLAAAAPLGAVIGFALGGVAMVPAAMCYAELATALPQAGGDVVYVRVAYGPRAAFMVGWFLVLMAVAVTSFEAIALAWFLDQLAPGHQGPVVYSLFGQDIRGGALAIGVGVTALIALVNWAGAHVSGRFQELFTYLKIAAILLFVVAALHAGSAANLSPPLTPTGGRPAIYGVLWIAATAALWYAGFQVIPQAIEERAPGTTLRTVGLMTVLSVLLGVLFYCAVVVASCLALPWRQLVGAPLPAAAAIGAVVPNPYLARAILACVVLGILATWNSAFLWGSRLLYALGRDAALPAVFGRAGRHRTPTAAIALVASLGVLGVLLGRGALIPIINMAAISLTFSYALACGAALRLRRANAALDRPFRVPGGERTMRLAVALTGSMALVGLLEPLTRGSGVPLEWRLLAAWSLVGLALRRRLSRARTEPAQRTV